MSSTNHNLSVPRTRSPSPTSSLFSLSWQSAHSHQSTDASTSRPRLQRTNTPPKLNLTSPSMTTLESPKATLSPFSASLNPSTFSRTHAPFSSRPTSISLEGLPKYPSPNPLDGPLRNQELRFIWDHAILLFENKIYSEAHEMFTHILRYANLNIPFVATTYINIGVCLSHMTEPALAAAYFREAAHLVQHTDVLGVIALYLCGCAESDAGRYQEAINAFQGSLDEADFQTHGDEHLGCRSFGLDLDLTLSSMRRNIASCRSILRSGTWKGSVKRKTAQCDLVRLPTGLVMPFPQMQDLDGLMELFMMDNRYGQGNMYELGHIDTDKALPPVPLAKV